MAVNLKTIPLRNVPIGGVFIANPKEINMECVDEGVTPYVKLENLSCDDMEFAHIGKHHYTPVFGTKHNADVVFTGIVFRLNPIKERLRKVWNSVY